MEKKDDYSLQWIHVLIQQTLMKKKMGLCVKEKGLVQNIKFLESSATINSDLVSFTLSPLDKSKNYKIKAFSMKI